MKKSNIILENEQILLIAIRFVFEGVLAVKAISNGEIEILNLEGNPVIKIVESRNLKVPAVKKLELKSFKIKLDQITLTSEDVEVLFLGS